MHPRLEHLAGGPSDLHPRRPGAEPHAGLGRGPASLGAARGGAHGGLREADPDPDAGLHELPLLDDTTAKEGPCAIILTRRGELVTQIEEVLRRGNYIVSTKADKRANSGFEDYVTRTLPTIPNIKMKVSSEDASTLIQPRKDSAEFRRLDIDRNDDEDKVHWTVKTLEQMNTRNRSFLQEDFQIFIPGGQVLNPCRFDRGPASLGAARGGTLGGLREADPDPDANLCERAASARRRHREGRPLRHLPHAAAGARHQDREILNQCTTSSPTRRTRWGS